MNELTKSEFIKKFKKELSGDDNKGYVYQDVFVSSEEFDEISTYQISDIEELRKMLDDHDEEGILNFKNALMGYIFGGGQDYQGSYEDVKGSRDYCWYLNLGEIKLCFDPDGLLYTNIRFYKDG